MASFEYLIGKRIISTYTFRRNDTPTDPTVIIFSVRHEDDDIATVSTYGGVMPVAIVRVSPGLYQISWKPDKHGIWTIRWEGSGAVDQAAEADIYILRSKVLGDAA